MTAVNDPHAKHFNVNVYFFQMEFKMEFTFNYFISHLIILSHILNVLLNCLYFKGYGGWGGGI